MNTDQIVKLAAFQANDIKADGSLAPSVTIPELYTWANDANFELEKAIRSINDDYFVRVMNSSTDTSAQKLIGIDYTPSTSLRLAASTSRFTLPPDFETLRTIRCVTAGYEYMTFEHKDLTHWAFQEQWKVPSSDTATPGGRIYYDIIGERTLFIAPQLGSAVDIEMVYVARTYPLHRYTTGTVTITTATTTVTGASSPVWSTGTPFTAAYLDIMAPLTAPTTLTNVDISWIYDGATRNRIASITSDTEMVLASNKVGTASAGSAYALSSVPALPPEHHHALADYVTAHIFAKHGKMDQFDRWMAKYERRKASILSTINVRDTEAQFVSDYDPEGVM